MKSNTYKKFATAIPALLTVGLLFGCAAAPSVESDSGTSVHHMVQGQIYDMEAAKNPPTTAPQGTDGIAAINKMESVQREAATAAGAKQVIKQRVFRYDVKE